MTRVNPVRGLGETFSDGVVAAAMIDRLVRHAEVLTSPATATGRRARSISSLKD